MAATWLAGITFHVVPQSRSVSIQNKLTLNKSQLYFPVRSSDTARLANRVRTLCFQPSSPVKGWRWKSVVYQKVAETEAKKAEEESDEELESDTGDSKSVSAKQNPISVLPTLLQAYQEAVADGDDAKLADVEAQLKVIEDEKNALSLQISSLKEELSAGKEKFLRLNADFDNFRKRSEKERRTLASNIQGEVIESLLPMVDNFERAKDQIKIQTEREEKIDKSYQGIYKQFVEIMKSLSVSAVDTVGKPFDPMLHEAIMREESTIYEEGIIIQEFRRGFILGERLLRPAMVKVSAGPGPEKDSAKSGEETKEIEQDPITSEPSNDSEKEV